MGLSYYLALGGEVPDFSLPKEAQECQDLFFTCNGNGRCFEEIQIFKKKNCLENSHPYKIYSNLVFSFSFSFSFYLF